MKRNVKKLLALLIVMVVTVCGACANADVNVTVNEDGTVHMVATTLLEKATVDKLKASMSLIGNLSGVAGDNGDTVAFAVDLFETELEKAEVVTVDGKEYYKNVEDELLTCEEAEEKMSSEYFKGAHISKDSAYFIYDLSKEDLEQVDFAKLKEQAMVSMYMQMLMGMSMDQAEEMLKAITVNVQITFPQPITFSNGEVVDGNTAKWTMNYGEIMSMQPGIQKFYAETTPESKIENDKTAPVVTGLKNKAVIRKGTLKASDAETGVAYIKVDETYCKEASVSLAGFENGKHTVMVLDYAGNVTTLTYTLDTVAPKVTGVANGKKYKKAVTVKFSDKNGIKSATLDGKKIKSGKKVSKKGKHTLKVTDKVGNTKTVKFTIK